MLVDEFERDPARGAFPPKPGDTAWREIPVSARRPHDPISHLELVRNADLYLVAPASANTIAKLAHGLADNLLCSAALAATCPLVVAPAMNNHMYEHPAVQANLQTLRARGVHVVEPDRGRLASEGEEGVGRLPDPARLLELCEGLLGEPGAEGERPPAAAGGSAPAGSWHGLRVLVTAGGTREPIDSVRYIGNGSSGRMGLALAQAAHARGAEVTVIAANVSLPRPAGVTWREVSTAAQLGEACEQAFPTCDVLLMVAAVADFRRRAGELGTGSSRRPTASVCVWSSKRPPTCSAGSPHTGVPDRRSWGSPPSTARARSPTVGASCGTRASTPSWSTTSPARTSGSGPTPTRSRSSPAAGEAHVPRAASKERVRRGDPRRCAMPPRVRGAPVQTSGSTVTRTHGQRLRPSYHAARSYSITATTRPRSCRSPARASGSPTRPRSARRSAASWLFHARRTRIASLKKFRRSPPR